MSPSPRHLQALPDDLRARVHDHRPGDEFTANGWQRPYVLPPVPPASPDARTVALRLLLLAAVALLLTLIVLAIGANT